MLAVPFRSQASQSQSPLVEAIAAEASSPPVTEKGLDRPSPINPDVPSAPRPADRILPDPVTEEDLKHTANKRQVIAHTEPGVPIPIKKHGETLDTGLKVPSEFATHTYNADVVNNSKPDEHKQVRRHADDADKEVHSKPDDAVHPQVHEHEHDDANTRISYSHPRHEEKLPRRDNPPRNTRNADHDETKPEESSSSVPTETPAKPEITHLSPVPSQSSDDQPIWHAKRDTAEKTNDENKKIDPHTDDHHHEVKHSPAFVHPVPVSQIIKNSAAVPVSHA